MAQFAFDPGAFVARYPEFGNVSAPLLGLYFDEAQMYLSNADNSPVQNVQRRGLLYNMLVAHIAALAGALSPDGKPPPVGRVSQASQGSVSASFEGEPVTAGTPAWFQQTQYGAAFWRATTAIRGFRYVLPTYPNVVQVPPVPWRT